MSLTYNPRLPDEPMMTLIAEQPNAAATVDQGEAQLLSLFRDWVALKRLARAVLVKEAEYEAAAVAVDKVESAIIEAPSSGAAGLAIKSYLSLHSLHKEGGGYNEDAAALGKRAINWDVDAGILRDAIRFVPELAPLAAAALDADDEAGICEGDGPEASPIAAPAEAKCELTEAERDLAETFIRLGYRPDADSADPEPDDIGFGESDGRQ